MSDYILSREHYDVRFLDIPKDKENQSLDDYVDSKIHSIYPGNNGAYEYIYRIFGTNTAVIVFITKAASADFGKRKPVIPAFILPELSGKLDEIECLCISHGKLIERIFIKDGIPQRSQLSDLRASELSVPDINTRWIFLDKPEDSPLQLDQSLILKTPRFTDFNRFKRIRNSRAFSFIEFYILAAILLLLAGGISFKYSALLDAEVSKRISMQNRIVQYQAQNTELEKEISEITSSIDAFESEEINSPYVLLTELYSIVGGDIKIRRISVQNKSFSMEAVSRNPIDVSDSLSKNGMFSDVSIQRIQDDDEGFRFSLSGRFNG